MSLLGDLISVKYQHVHVMSALSVATEFVAKEKIGVIALKIVQDLRKFLVK